MREVGRDPGNILIRILRGPQAQVKEALGESEVLMKENLLPKAVLKMATILLTSRTQESYFVSQVKSPLKVKATGSPILASRNGGIVLEPWLLASSTHEDYFALQVRIPKEVCGC